MFYYLYTTPLWAQIFLQDHNERQINVKDWKKAGYMEREQEIRRCRGRLSEKRQRHNNSQGRRREKEKKHTY